MTGLKDIMELLAGWAAQSGVNLSPPNGWPSPPTLIAVLLVLGVILALWGSRLLRLFYVLTFTGVGGALGVKVARMANVDALIGLVIGAGIIGLIGHLLFRWWVGVTAACCAALLLLTWAASRNSEALIAALQEYHEQQQVVVVAAPPPAESPGNPDSPAGPTSVVAQATWALRTYVVDAFSYFRQTRHNAVTKVVIVAVLAWFTGLGIGLTLPRFTTILGTACVGVALIGLGLGVLLTTYSPATLDSMAGREKYVAVGSGVLILISLLVQVRHRRPVPQATDSPAPASKAV